MTKGYPAASLCVKGVASLCDKGVFGSVAVFWHSQPCTLTRFLVHLRTSTLDLKEVSVATTMLVDDES